MEPALIFGFYNVKRKSLSFLPDGTLIHRRLPPSRSWYSFTYPGRIESWVSLGGKEGRTNIQIMAELRIQMGTLWSENRYLTNCTNHACPNENNISKIKTKKTTKQYNWLQRTWQPDSDPFKVLKRFVDLLFRYSLNRLTRPSKGLYPSQIS